MEEKSPQKEDERKRREQLLVILRFVKISGAVFIILGGAVYADLFGISTSIGLTETNIHHILGPVLFLVGVADFIAVPRVFEKIFAEKK
ncbi:MAG: hypothetical protein KBC88_07900 [Alphaproteobacteria bacterium]|jgi:hypothetical protein|nr:hypothetical protein [Alphaproteobacteria bacterium]